MSSPQQERGGASSGSRRSPEPAWRWRWLLWLLFAAFFVPLALSSLKAGQAWESIRYDEFKRYIREGRVAWVQIGPSELRGAYRPERKPPPRRAGPPHTEGFVTGRVQDDNLVAFLERHRVPFRAVASSSWKEQWPWMLYLLVTIGFLVFVWGGLFRRMAAGPSGAIAFGRNRSRIYTEKDVGVRFDDVAGVEEAKEELREIIEFLRNPQKYRRLGARTPKGVLLVGPPGTGKTLLARAVAGEAKVPFLSISGSEFVEMFVGVGAARVRDLFEQAAKSAPCIVFIDEIDALGRSRASAHLGGTGTNEEREQTLQQLLVEMDGFEPHQSVVIMAATNRPEVLDPALLRPGRFDRQIVVDRPDRAGRLAILRVHARKVPLDDDVDLDELAKRTPGFAGADLANLVNEAALLAARAGRERVTMADFSRAVDRVVAGIEKKSRIVTEEERRRVAYHEVGHALASTLVGADDQVHKISIVPRGMGALGFTMQLPTEDRYLMTQSAIRARLVGLLGGRVAERLVFGELSTGAQDDLRKATDIARAMVVEYGMSERLGPLAVGSERRPLFLRGREGGGVALARGEVGERLADVVDEEVRAILDDAERTAERLLRSHRDALERIAARLMDREVLEGEELARLLQEAKRATPASEPSPASPEGEGA